MPLAGTLHHAVALHRGEVGADGGGGQVEAGGDVVRGEAAVLQKADDAATGGVE